eukprot:EG_transcript_1928
MHLAASAVLRDSDEFRNNMKGIPKVCQTPGVIFHFGLTTDQAAGVAEDPDGLEAKFKKLVPEQSRFHREGRNAFLAIDLCEQFTKMMSGFEEIVDTLNETQGKGWEVKADLLNMAAFGDPFEEWFRACSLKLSMFCDEKWSQVVQRLLPTGFDVVWFMLNSLQLTVEMHSLKGVLEAELKQLACRKVAEDSALIQKWLASRRETTQQEGRQDPQSVENADPEADTPTKQNEGKLARELAEKEGSAEDTPIWHLLSRLREAVAQGMQQVALLWLQKMKSFVEVEEGLQAELSEEGEDGESLQFKLQSHLQQYIDIQSLVHSLKTLTVFVPVGDLAILIQCTLHIPCEVVFPPLASLESAAQEDGMPPALLNALQAMRSFTGSRPEADLEVRTFLRKNQLLQYEGVLVHELGCERMEFLRLVTDQDLREAGLSEQARIILLAALQGDDMLGKLRSRAAESSEKVIYVHLGSGQVEQPKTKLNLMFKDTVVRTHEYEETLSLLGLKEVDSTRLVLACELQLRAVPGASFEAALAEFLGSYIPPPLSVRVMVRQKKCYCIFSVPSFSERECADFNEAVDNLGNVPTGGIRCVGSFAHAGDLVEAYAKGSVDAILQALYGHCEIRLDERWYESLTKVASPDSKEAMAVAGLGKKFALFASIAEMREILDRVTQTLVDEEAGRDPDAPEPGEEEGGGKRRMAKQALGMLVAVPELLGQLLEAMKAMSLGLQVSALFKQPKLIRKRVSLFLQCRQLIQSLTRVFVVSGGFGERQRAFIVHGECDVRVMDLLRSLSAAQRAAEEDDSGEADKADLGRAVQDTVAMSPATQSLKSALLTAGVGQCFPALLNAGFESRASLQALTPEVAADILPKPRQQEKVLELVALDRHRGETVAQLEAFLDRGGLGLYAEKLYGLVLDEWQTRLKEVPTAELRDEVGMKPMHIKRFLQLVTAPDGGAPTPGADEEGGSTTFQGTLSLPPGYRPTHSC